MLANLIMFNMYIVPIPKTIPYSLFFIFVGYDNMMALSIIISYTPVHSNTISRVMPLGRYMEPSIINVFIPMTFNIPLETCTTLNVPIIGRFSEYDTDIKI